MNLDKFSEITGDREAWHAAVHGVTKSQTGLRDWTNKQPPPRAHAHRQAWTIPGRRQEETLFHFNHACVLRRSVISDSCHSVDCSPTDSSVHGIFQASRLEWVAILSSGRSSWPRSPALKAESLLSVPPGKPTLTNKWSWIQIYDANFQ